MPAGKPTWSSRSPLIAQFSPRIPVGDSISPTESLVFLMNSMTGISILTLPYAFSKAGFLLGLVIMSACMLVAFITATFMCEAFAIATGIQYDQAVEQEASGQPADPAGPHQALLQSYGTDSSPDARDRKFKFRERMEMGYLGELLFKQKVLIGGVYGVMVAQMYGSNTVLCVIVNKALSHAVESIMQMCGSTADENRIYQISVIVTFLVVFPLCLADLQKTKKFTAVVMTLKFIAMALFVIVSAPKVFVVWQQEGESIFEHIPMWNSDYATLVFGNSVFLFCQHHMLPSMTAPVQPQGKIPLVIGTGFLLITLISCLINITALLAWTSESAATCSAEAGGHFCAIQPMYNLNFAPLSWLHGFVGIFIVAYPAMSTANFPVQAITTRNTLTLLLGLEPTDPAKPFAAQNLILLLAVLMPPFAVALVSTDVQTMIQYVGGYAGLTIGFLIPMLLVIYGRRLKDATGSESIPMKSCFANHIGYSVTFLFYLVGIAVVTEKLFFTT